jgi:alanyl-tRNA synthetase
MTERLYYEDAYYQTFEAEVLAQRTHDGLPAVVLDRTAFYPTGGGQPNDLGKLGGARVADVVAAGEDVLHVLDGDPPAGRVTGAIDWARRFDHMQHHTGQHILSAAFIDVAGAQTVGFHLGVESVTIDLDKPQIRDADLEAAEDLSNLMVWQNLPVRAWFPTEAELAALTVRKEIGDFDKVRIVQVGDFDATACGGTHVAHTGEVGIIKVLKLERRGEKTRVEFRCGGRALLDYRQKNASVNQLSAAFTVGAWEVTEAVDRLRDDFKEARSAFNRARGELLTHTGDAVLREAAERGGVRLVRRAFDAAAGYDAKDLSKLAGQLAQAPGTVVLLGLAGEKAQLILARAEDLDHNMVPALKTALAVLDTARGGGRPGYASGGGVPASVAQIEAALDAAEQVVLEG